MRINNKPAQDINFLDAVKKPDANDLLKKHYDKMHVGNTDHHLTVMAEQCDIIFVPIQTPHDPKYEGVTRIPDERVDFDYSYLKAGIKQLAEAIECNCRGTSRVITSL